MEQSNYLGLADPDVSPGLDWFLLCFVHTLLVSLMRTTVIGLRAHLGHLLWPYLKILNLMTSTKTVFPNKTIFIGFRDLGISLKPTTRPTTIVKCFLGNKR